MDLQSRFLKAKCKNEKKKPDEKYKTKENSDFIKMKIKFMRF